jgi:hypothetical protein
MADDASTKVRRGTSPAKSAQVRIGFTNVGLWYPTAKGFIQALLNLDPSPHPTAQISGSTMLTSTTITTGIQLPTCRLNVSGEMLCLDTSLSSQKQGNKVGRARGK